MPGDRGSCGPTWSPRRRRHPPRVGRRRAGAGVAPARARHLRRCRACAGAGQPRSRRDRRRRRDEGARACRVAARGGLASPSPSPRREASARAGAPPGRAHRVAVSPERPVSRCRRPLLVVSGGHTSLLSGHDRPASTACSGERAMTPRARRTTRSPSCWDSTIRADPSSIVMARQGNDRAIDLPLTRHHPR